MSYPYPHSLSLSPTIRPVSGRCILLTLTPGHVRQFDVCASRLPVNLSEEAPLMVGNTDGYVFLNIDETIIEVLGHQKQGSGYVLWPRIDGVIIPVRRVCILREKAGNSCGWIDRSLRGNR